MNSGIVKPNMFWGIAITFLAALIFGFHPVGTRGAYADGANVTFMLFFTTYLRTAFLVGFCYLTGKALFKDRQDRKVALWSGVYQSISMAGIIAGCFFLEGPIVIILLFTATLMLMLYMVWKGEARLDTVTVVGTLFTLFGVTVVIDLWQSQSNISWIGVGLILMASVTSAARTYLYGKRMKATNPVVVGAESFVIASVLILPMVLWEMPILPETIEGWGFACLSGVSFCLGTLSMFYAIALAGAFRFSLLLKIEPIFTALFSVWLLDEYLKSSQYLGMGVVIVSLVGYQILSHRKEKRLAALKVELET